MASVYELNRMATESHKRSVVTDGRGRGVQSSLLKGLAVKLSRCLCGGGPLLSNAKDTSDETGKTNDTIVKVNETETGERVGDVENVPDKLVVSGGLFGGKLLELDLGLFVGSSEQDLLALSGQLVSAQRLDNAGENAKEPKVGADLLDGLKVVKGLDLA